MILHGCAINGVLWGQGADGAISSYDGVPGESEAPEVYSMRVVTGQQKVGEVPLAWGRVRGVGVHGRVLDNHTLRVRVYADDRDRVITNKAVSVVESDPTTWPSGLAPEFRTTSQRCATFKVELIATPAHAEWTSVDAWISGTNERAPSRSRS